MSRTNKQWIAKKKAQQQKQAARIRWVRRFDYPKRKLSLEEGKELWAIGVYTNPKWWEYHWFIRGRKICWETRLRVDPDGFRYIRTPSGGSEMVSAPISGRVRTRMRRNIHNR